jgi:hypothetical protein
VPITVRWSSVVAQCTMAAGLSAGRPAAISPWQVCSNLPETIKTTSVSTAVAMEDRSISSPCAQLAVTTAKLRSSPRCVTGMPAAPGAAIALVTPGTIR